MKVVTEMCERAADRKWRETAHRTQRSVGHHLAQVDEHVEVGVGVAFVNASMRDTPFGRIVYRPIVPDPPLIELNIMTRTGETNPLVEPFIRHLFAALKPVPSG